MAAYRRVFDSRHLQADCQEPGSAPEPHAAQSSMGYLCLYCRDATNQLPCIYRRAVAIGVSISELWCMTAPLLLSNVISRLHLVLCSACHKTDVTPAILSRKQTKPTRLITVYIQSRVK